VATATHRALPDTFKAVSKARDERRARFEDLYDEHAETVLRYALRRTDADAAGDVLADTFLVAWRRLERVPSEPRPWLLAVARRVLANHRRGEARREALVIRLASEPRRRRPDPSEGAGVAGALDRLSSRDREALLLVYWDGLSPGEAAQVLGCSALAFRSRLHRARRRLSHALEADEEAETQIHDAYVRAAG
jgi:RNA polymerase sigma factor (sigma-70 family)